MCARTRSLSTNDLSRLGKSDGITRENHAGGLQHHHPGVRRTSETTSYDFSQPIKRTRSDQSLCGMCDGDGGGPGVHQHSNGIKTFGRLDADGTNAQLASGTSHGTAALSGCPPVQSLGRGAWLSCLPVVLSDGSSTNSLVSVDSDFARSSSSLTAGQQQGQQQGQGQQPNVCYLPAAGSAASLQHGALGGGSGFSPGGGTASVGAGLGSSLLFRTQSDYSDSGNGVPDAPLFPPASRAFSPPPLIPQGPLAQAPAYGMERGGRSAAVAAAAAAAAAALANGRALPPVRTHALAPDALSLDPRGRGAFAGAHRVPVTGVALDAGNACGGGGGQVRLAPAGWGMGSGGGSQAFAAAVAFGGAAGAAPATCLNGLGWGQADSAGGFSRGRGAFGMLQGQTQASLAAAFSQPAAATPAAAAAAAPALPPPPRDSRSFGSLPDDGWDFSRRAQLQRSAGRTESGSSSMGRRRSSIEASMPWRLRLENAIAAAGADTAEHRAGPDARGADGALTAAQLAELEAADRAAAAQLEEQLQRQLQRQHGSSPEHTNSGRSATSEAGLDRRSSSESESEGGGAAPGARGGQRGRTSTSSSGGGSEAGRSADSPVSGPRAGKMRRSGGASCSSGYYARQHANGAAFELFVRLNRARQTLDFAKRQAHEFAELDHAQLSVWEALDTLEELREYEAALPPPSEELDPTIPLKEHALQVAELCRLAFPDKEWLALVGLVHGLGKLLAHPSFGSQPQWAVAGETYPLGCRFAPQIGHSEFFAANPDRRRRGFSTPNGVYTPGCGLKEVYMSWSAPEFLYLVLVLNQVALPEEALFIIRYQKFYSLTRPGGAYRQLLSPEDEALLPLLSAFQRLSVYRRVELPPEALRGQVLYDYYDALVAKYFGTERLFW